MVLIKIAAFLLICGNAACPGHNSCKVSHLCRIQIRANPRDQYSVTGCYNIVLSNNRTV